MPVRPGAESYRHDGGEVAVLMCHGFTGNPSSLRPWAQYLADAGYTVAVPRLPGHGTTWRDMARTRWSDWYEELERSYLSLRKRHQSVVVAGLSMGGALSLRLAQRQPEVTGLVLVNPAVRIEDPRLAALPVLRWLLPWLPGVGNDIAKPGVQEDAYDRIPPHALHSMLAGYREVVAQLPQVQQPLLLLRSPQDHVVPASSSATITDRIGSGDVTELLCERSYHVATLDHDAELIQQESVRFIRRITSADPEATTSAGPAGPA